MNPSPSKVLEELYDFFKPRKETAVWATKSGKRLTEVNVHWQYANFTCRWHIVRGKVLMQVVHEEVIQ